MAIVVEERKNPAGGIVNFLIWLFILGSVASAVYYIFFASPELVEVVAPHGFQATEQVAKIELNPQEVLDDPRFQALQQRVTPPSLGAFGRPNPFLGF